MSSGYRRTWCRGRRAVTPCLSSRCYHDFSISVNFAKSFKLRAYRSCTSLASGLSSSLITATHCYASRISRTSPQRRACGVTSASRCVVRRSLRAGCLGGLSSVGSSPRLRLHVPGPWSVIFWTCHSRARPSLRVAPWLPLLLNILQRCFRSTAGAAILRVFPLVPTSGVHPQSVPGPSRLSVYLTDPP